MRVAVMTPEELLNLMEAEATKNGFAVIRVKYADYRVPVLRELADQYHIVEGQEVSDEQMMMLTDAMDLFLSGKLTQ